MIIEIILLLLALPVGYLIAGITSEELVDGRGWFYVIMAVSMILALWAVYENLAHIALSFVFMAIVSFISIVKSRDKKRSL